MDGSIDFLCFPRFDSPSIFGALLDDRRGGRFRLAPVLEDARCRQLYLPDTTILLTRFLSDAGVAEISDFMPVSGDCHDIVRRAKTVRGEVRYRMVCAPAFEPRPGVIAASGVAVSAGAAGRAVSVGAAAVPVVGVDSATGAVVATSPTGPCAGSMPAR